MWGRRFRSAGDPQLQLQPMEFVEEDGAVRQQASPTKQAAVISAPGERAGAPQAEARGGKAAPAAAPHQQSPTAVAASTYTASQPSSATSSLAAALADLQVSSRQSSADDLGDRQRILAGLPPGLAAVHTRRGSGGGGGGGGGEDAPPSPSDSCCSPQMVGAIQSFDSFVLRSLTPIKTRSRVCSSAAAELPPSPPAPFADRLVSPFREGHPGLRPKLAPGRPLVFHTGGGGGGLPAAPGAYNPYDLTAAALSSEFRAPSAAGCSSRATSTSATPSQWGSSGARASSYRALAAQHALTARDEEPDFYVSVPGVVRRQHSGAAAAALAAAASRASSIGSSASGPAAAAAEPQRLPPAGAAGAASIASSSSDGSASPQPVPSESPAAAGLARSGGSLGSGGLLAHQRSLSGGGFSAPGLHGTTAVHGFRGLFKNLVMGPPTGVR